LVTPLGQGLDGRLLGVTHGSFSLVVGFQGGEYSLVQGLLDLVEVGLVAKGAQCAKYGEHFFVGQSHGNFSGWLWFGFVLLDTGRNNGPASPVELSK
jgi:hypothetical protein